MSRIGKKPIPVPDGVKINIAPDKFEVTGPKGSVNQVYPEVIKLELDEVNKVIKVVRPNDSKENRAFHGLTRALMANAIHGVVNLFEKRLSIVGTGYNAKLKGKHLELQIGYCLPQMFMIPDGITVEVPTATRIFIKGADKQLVGQFAHNVRMIRPPEPYKGKGIRYEGEVVKLKAGKSFAGSG